MDCGEAEARGGMAQRTGGRILIDALIGHGADMVFSVPGESFLGALEALRQVEDRVRLIVCRQEGGAANMAEAYGKLTGRPGLCFVTRGPGVANASVGLHTARQDSTPMLLLVGQVGRDMSGREAFQEIDFRRMLGEVTKWVDQVEDPARIPEYVARAYAIAMSGRRGPVALVFPEDVLTELAETTDAPPQLLAEPAPSREQLAELRLLLGAAERPLAIVGGSGWTETACADLVAFAEAYDLPVAAAFRCQDRMDNAHRLYVGELGASISPELSRRARGADLLIAIGDRLGEMTTSGYSLVLSPVPAQKLVHVHPGAEELGRVFATALPINAGVGSFLAAAAGLKPAGEPAWRSWAEEARREFEAQLAVREFPGAIDFGAVMTTIRERLSPDAIVTNGAGNYTGWCMRHYLYRRYPTQLGPVSGAMGYGFPAAIAAKALHPGRDVVCFAGDGCFLMTGQELATAVHYNINVVTLILDNSMYGTIRMHQERSYPGKPYATALTNPDFAAYARAFGAHGETVRATQDFAPAFERALTAGRPALVHVVMDPEIISTRATLSELRDKAMASGC
jgi:acetolactate synthase-1/2/3 large subunit